jgi:hypothetical protein
LLVVGCWLLVVGCWLLVVGCWLFDAQAAVASANELGAGKFTAMNFWPFMMTLNRVFIQDAAAMLVLHPKRIINLEKLSHHYRENMPKINKVLQNSKRVC